ncbi:MAG: hypothetical protein VW239_04125 [Candidatus Nanopelagicales bacterium]
MRITTALAALAVGPVVAHGQAGPAGVACYLVGFAVAVVAVSLVLAVSGWDGAD